ncbi:MAG: hypothetical protein ACJ78H_04760 [Chloroflexota bacterium]
MNLLRRLRGPAIDEDGVTAVLYYYYLDPQPKLALAAFERCVKSGMADPGSPDELASTAWVFGRIAGMNPDMQDAVQRILDRRGVSTSPYGRMVLETAAAGEGAAQRLLTRPLTSAIDIAFLGAEAVVTGSLDPFVRMIDGLGAPDLVRLRLEQWLHGEPGGLVVRSVDEAMEILATDYHIVVGADPPGVLTVSDCDLMVMVEKPLSITVHKQGERSPKPGSDRRPFPVQFREEVAQPMRLKLSAYSALADGLNEHEGLLDRVRSELPRRMDLRVRIDLLELLAGHELPKFRTAAGIGLLEQILEIDPYRSDLKRLVERLRRDPFMGLLDGR